MHLLSQDTVFIKDVHAYNQLLDEFDADGSFMYEEANKTAPGANHTHLIRYMNRWDTWSCALKINMPVVPKHFLKQCFRVDTEHCQAPRMCV